MCSMKISFSNKFKILKYSLLNEFSIDEFDMLSAYKRFSKISVYPRTSKFVSFFGDNFTTLIIVLFISLFSVFLWPLYFFYQFIFKKQKIKVYKNTTILDNTIAILTDKDLVNKNYTILNKASFVISICDNDLSLFSNFKLIKVKYINFFDLVGLVETIILNFYFIFFVKDFKFKMFPQLYILFSLNLHIKTINRIIQDLNLSNCPSIIHTSHYDRWGVLFDFLGKNNSLVQHGILNNSFFCFYKQMNISKVYLLDKQSGDIFGQNHISSKFDIEIIKYVLPLRKIFNDFTILFISRPADFKFEKKILDELIKFQFQIKFIFKPHPAYDSEIYYKLQNKFDDSLFIYEDKLDFPYANVIISGNSTLAFEYVNNGFDVISISTPIEIIKNKISKLYEDFQVSL